MSTIRTAAATNGPGLVWVTESGYEMPVLTYTANAVLEQAGELDERSVAIVRGFYAAAARCDDSDEGALALQMLVAGLPAVVQ